jgi:hypothetical protein
MSAVIVTRYHGPTNTKGARVSASMAGAPTAWIPYPAGGGAGMIALAVFLSLALLVIVFDL